MTSSSHDRRGVTEIKLRVDKPTVDPTPSMSVMYLPTGRLVIEVSAENVACLVGRDGFGDLDQIRDDLGDKVADAWYAAGCPS